MLFSTPQLARVVVSKHGTEFQENLKWNDKINSKISGCYGNVSVLRKFKNLAPFKLRKQLAETLILSQIDYNDALSNPIPDYLMKRLQRVQLATAGFVLRLRFTTMPEILFLGWRHFSC